MGVQTSVNILSKKRRGCLEEPKHFKVELKGKGPSKGSENNLSERWDENQVASAYMFMEKMNAGEF